MKKWLSHVADHSMTLVEVQLWKILLVTGLLRDVVRVAQAAVFELPRSLIDLLV
jgi:hypothetical protein